MLSVHHCRKERSEDQWRNLQHHHTGDFAELPGMLMPPLGTECSRLPTTLSLGDHLPVLPTLSQDAFQWQFSRTVELSMSQQMSWKRNLQKRVPVVLLRLMEGTPPTLPLGSPWLRGTCWEPASTQSKWFSIVGGHPFAVPRAPHASVRATANR